MMKTKLLTKNVAAIGEAISHELGAQFIKDYQKTNSSDVQSYVIGKDIINQILAQPGCAGIQFYNAYNEIGEKTLVYTGLNTEGNPLLTYSIVNNEGLLETQKGIVADRAERGRAEEADDWYWIID